MEAFMTYLGVACRKIAVFKKVAGSSKKRAKKKQTDPKAILQGNAFLRLGMYQKAIKSYEQALKGKVDDDSLYFNLGNAYRHEGMYKEAVKAYKYVVHITPNHAKAYQYLGISCGRVGLHKQAQDYLKQAITIEPNNAEAHFNLAVVYKEMLDDDAATEEYRIVEKLSPLLAEKLSAMLNRKQ